MAEKLDPKQVVTFEELLRAMMMETEATRRILVWKRTVVWVFLLAGLLHLVRLGVVETAAVVMKQELEQALTLGMDQIIRNLEAALPR